MHSIQSRKLSNFHKHQEEGFQAIEREKINKLIKTKTKKMVKTDSNNINTHTHILSTVFHLQVSMVHTLFMTMINSVYKLLKIAPRFIFRKPSQLNLQIQKQCHCNINNKQNRIKSPIKLLTIIFSISTVITNFKVRLENCQSLEQS